MAKPLRHLNKSIAIPLGQKKYFWPWRELRIKLELKWPKTKIFVKFIAEPFRGHACCGKDTEIRSGRDDLSLKFMREMCHFSIQGSLIVPLIRQSYEGNS